MSKKKNIDIPLRGNIENDRYWMVSMYTENMLPTWKDDIDELLRRPYSYCVHDKDKDEFGKLRKEHVHIILAYPNTTTYKHAYNLFNRLTVPGKISIHQIEACINVRNCDNYLIHDTDDCRKKGKFQYSIDERIRGNDYDIGAYEQVSIQEQNEIVVEISNLICVEQIQNYADLFEYLLANFDDWKYFNCLRSHSSHFNRLCDGVYRRKNRKDYSKQLAEFKYKEQNKNMDSNIDSNTSNTYSNTSNTFICCPKCGSINYKKNGKTIANTQRFVCKDCCSSFVFS